MTNSSKTRRSRGFTLIELLVVVVIIGILAAISIPKFMNTKSKAYGSSLKSDLKNLTTSEETYFYSNGVYAGNPALVNFTASSGVDLVITEASGTGWSATTTHPAANPLVCSVFYGNAAAVWPASQEGVVSCQ